MEKLKVRIYFKSGHQTDIESNDYYKGQFREWCNSQLVNQKSNRAFDFIIWNNIFINIYEIERIEEIN